MKRGHASTGRVVNRGSAGDRTEPEPLGIPIERGIPVAARKRRIGRPRSPIAIALLKLRVGESFAVPLEKRKQLQSLSTQTKAKTVGRYVTREHEGVARVWRIA